MKRIVTIGGGTGSFTILSGIKNIPDVDISAVVSMADDGGSTGVLRDELGVLPPGDIRQCLVALSEHSDVVRRLMNYRYENSGLKGHSFGNILLATLEKVTGNLISGIEVASDILKIKGKVIPVTNNLATLSIKLKNKKIIERERKINKTNIQKIGIKRIFYKEKVALNPHAKIAIQRAHYIILGPGNYYSSIVPNLIVEGFRDAIKITKAKIIFPINLTNKHGHTLFWNASDYVSDVEKYLNKKIDLILLNNENPSINQVKNYKIREGDGVLVKDDVVNSRALRMPLLSHVLVPPNAGDKISNSRSFIRHDSEKLAEAIKKIITR